MANPSGRNNLIIDKFCRGLSLCPRSHTVQREDVTCHVFCFADVASAERFRARFGGERFDPKDILGANPVPFVSGFGARRTDSISALPDMLKFAAYLVPKVRAAGACAK